MDQPQTLAELTQRILQDLPKSSAARLVDLRPLPDSKPRSGSAKTSCEVCRGQVFYVKVRADGRSELATCLKCRDLTKTSGLTPEQHRFTWSALRDLEDKTGSMAVLRYAGRQIVAGAGAPFATVYGNTGNAKSLWGRVIVAELCRNGVQAHYTRAKVIERGIFRHDGETEVIEKAQGDLYRRVQALVVDEAQGINWKSQWINDTLQPLFDARYEAAKETNPAEREITLFLSQFDPTEWAPDWLLDRMRQGTWALPWPANEPTPECLKQRNCPRCGKAMRHVSADGDEFMACGCGVERSIEVFWPFHDLADSARPIMPAHKFKPFSKASK